MVDKRCIYCNWLHKEVGNEFICENCNKQNGKKEIVKEESEAKNIYKSQKEVKINGV